jgi:3',5'-cyclic AMP phosphodiesterase CpdA
LINFDKELNLFSQRFAGRDKIGLIKVGTQEGGYEFTLRLHDRDIPPSSYDMPERIVVISDPHGDVTSFVTVLQGAGVINEQLDWSFGQGHLVILGDVSNRGDDVTAIYWLTYKLEEEARKAGGKVHLVIGNHEVMVAQNDLRYTTPKYREIAQKMDIEYNTLWSSQTELGSWINSRNSLITIGDMLFLHGGISPNFAAVDLSIAQVNDTIRKYITLPRNATEHSPVAHLIMRSNGPLWYRGLILPNEEITGATVDEILKRYGVRKIVVGHTILDEVSEFFDGRIICVKVNSKRNIERGTSRGIVITPTDLWAIDNKGNRLEFGHVQEAKSEPLEY